MRVSCCINIQHLMTPTKPSRDALGFWHTPFPYCLNPSYNMEYISSHKKSPWYMYTLIFICKGCSWTIISTKWTHVNDRNSLCIILQADAVVQALSFEKHLDRSTNCTEEMRFFRCDWHLVTTIKKDLATAPDADEEWSHWTLEWDTKWWFAVPQHLRALY